MNTPQTRNKGIGAALVAPAHTPGPWHRGNAFGCGPGLAVCRGAFVVARVVGTGYPVGVGASAESNANAALIAAAPELLEALKTLALHVELHATDGRFRNAMAAAHVAIDRAEGRSV